MGVAGRYHTLGRKEILFHATISDYFSPFRVWKKKKSVRGILHGGEEIMQEKQRKKTTLSKLLYCYFPDFYVTYAIEMLSILKVFMTDDRIRELKIIKFKQVPSTHTVILYTYIALYCSQSTFSCIKTSQQPHGITIIITASRWYLVKWRDSPKFIKVVCRDKTWTWTNIFQAVFFTPWHSYLERKRMNRY